MDEESGLYYNRFRYYEPRIGSYMSQDPIGLKSGILAIYRYVNSTNIALDILGLSHAYKLKKLWKMPIGLLLLDRLHIILFN